MLNKSNAHEVNSQFQHLDNKVEEMYQEMREKMASFALQKDLCYLSTMMEQKANIEEVNESLNQKANKASVANALQRKANRADIDNLLEQKAELTDLEKVLGILEGKADISRLDDLA